MQAINTVLQPVNNDIYNYPSSEPQRVSLRAPNQAVVCIDTFDRTEPNPSTSSFNGTRLILGGVKRFAVLDMHIIWHGMNITPINNTVRFTFNDFSYEIQVPIGKYDTPKKIMDALAAAMNAAVSIPGVIAWTDNPLIPGFGNLSSSGAAFAFLECPATRYGRYLWNLPISEPAVSHTIGQVAGIYTRWIDVISQELSQYVKNPNTSTSSPNYPSPGNLVGRFFLNTENEGYFEVSRRNMAYQNFEISNDLQSLDIRFRDEWGNPLYLHDNNDISLEVYVEA